MINFGEDLITIYRNIVIATLLGYYKITYDIFK